MNIRITYDYPPYEFAFCALAMMTYINEINIPSVETVEQYDSKSIKKFVRGWMELHNSPYPAAAREWLANVTGDYTDAYEAARIKLETL